MVKNMNIDFDKLVHIFNTEGKESAVEFLSSTYGVEYATTIRLLRKNTNYRFNKSTRKYEELSNDNLDFMSMEQLCKVKDTEATKIVASVPEKVYCKDPMDSLTLDLEQDRLLEMAKFIKISPSSKTINININRLRDSGYDIELIN